VFFTEVLNVITLQIYSQTFEKELPSIYVCRNKVAFQHTRYKAEVEQAMQKVESLTDTLEAAEKEASWESISKYVVARLKLWERDDSEDTNAEIPAEIPTEECAHILNDASFIPYLCKLTGESEVLLYVLKVISFNIHSERLFLFVTIRLPQTMHMTPS
jgi:hypothetical protein